MKVAIFVPSLNGGGAERVMVTLANSFAARGFSVDLVLADAKGVYLNSVLDSVEVINLNSGRVIKALIPLAKYLRQNRPQALLSAMGHANVVALLARKLARVPVRVIVSERGHVSGEFALAQGIAARLIFLLIPILYRTADGICSVSHSSSRDLADFAHLPLSRVQTIYNPFDLSLIADLAVKPLVHPWIVPHQPPLIVAMGRLNEAKDFSILIRAFAKLQEKRKARLIILGEGELRPMLENLILQLGLESNQIQLLGFTPNPFAWLSRCSLFVLSSRREGLPGALIEAMACGAPVVSTNCLSGPDEILEGGRWGQLVPVGDVSGLSEAMSSSLDMLPEDRPNVRLRAADFEQKVAVDAYLHLLGLPLNAREKFQL